MRRPLFSVLTGLVLLVPRPAAAKMHVKDMIRQFETAWKLTSFHLEGLTTSECLWRPTREGVTRASGS